MVLSLDMPSDRTNTMLRFHRSLVPASLSALLLSSSFVAQAQADAQYTTQTSVVQGGALKPISTMTTFAKDGLQRMDSITSIGNYHAEERSISNAAKKEHLTIDPSLKIFVSESLSASGGIGGGAGTDGATSQPSGGTGVGTLLLTLGTQFLGHVKMLGFDARHYKSSTTMDATGCCGAGHTALKTETWMADVKVPVLQVRDSSFDWKSAYSQSHPHCKISFTRKGDVAKYEAAQKGLALKIITFDANGKAIAQTEITKLSLAPISAATFQVPSGFTKVTRAEYNQKRQQAMIAAMTSGASGAARATSADDNN